MSYNIEYDLSLPEQAQAQAIADCKDWLGSKKFKKVINLLKEDKGRTSRNIVIFALSFQGIQGYPAEAMVNKYWNPQRELDI
jgi:hypothetical protein